MNVQDMVAEFHEKFGHPVFETPGLIPDDRADLRWNLIYEELTELEYAQGEDDLVEIADALGDLLYVVYGAALEYGIDMAPVVDEIHRSNMSKLGEDGRPVPHPTVPGKIGKGPNYSPPDIARVLRKQGWEE